MPETAKLLDRTDRSGDPKMRLMLTAVNHVLNHTPTNLIHTKIREGDDLAATNKSLTKPERDLLRLEQTDKDRDDPNRAIRGLVSRLSRWAGMATRTDSFIIPARLETGLTEVNYEKVATELRGAIETWLKNPAAKISALQIMEGGQIAVTIERQY